MKKGETTDDVNIYSLDLSPVWNYNLKTLNIVNSEHISYNFEVKQNNNPVSEELKKEREKLDVCYKDMIELVTCTTSEDYYYYQK